MKPEVLRRGVSLAATICAVALPAAAQMPPMPKPSHDFKAAPAGVYAIDPKHTAIVIRVPHIGFSYSVFRFETVSAKLNWDPANPAADKLEATVDPKSIATGPVEGFSQELSGEKFLNAGKFPTATFVSTGFRPIDATHGEVSGEMTIMGVKTPVTFQVELVGAGQGFRGPVIGVSAHTRLDPKAYALPPFIPADIELNIDSEFDKQG
jgi:polyisoprenoid-binding protein YceI